MKKKLLAMSVVMIIAIAVLVFVPKIWGAEPPIFTDSFEGAFNNGVPENWIIHGAMSDTNSITMGTGLDNVSDGVQSVHIVDGSATAAMGIRSRKIDVLPNTTYAFNVDVKVVASGSLKMYVKWYDSNNVQISSKSVSTSGVTRYFTTLSTVITLPNNAAKVELILCYDGSAFGESYIDNVQVYSYVPKAGFVQDAPTQLNPSGYSSLVVPNGEKLTYPSYNEVGDKIADFSYAGYYAGEKMLPNSEDIEVAETLYPTGTNEDDTARIQQVINRVAQTITPGEMKMIKLKAGIYNINVSGIVLKSGIVLSGEGQGPNGTVLYGFQKAGGKTYAVVRCTGSDIAAPTADKKVNITDDYVKVGSDVINVQDPSKFNVGDTIAVYHPSTNKWGAYVEMSDIINVYNNPTSWTAGKVDMYTERTIKAIEGNKITLDFGLYTPLNKSVSESYIYKLENLKVIEDFGVENLRIDSYFDKTIKDENGRYVDEDHVHSGVRIEYAKNGFVRDVSAKHFVHNAVVNARKSKQITIMNVSALEPISQIAGSRRYSFACSTSAQQILITNCYSQKGRHDFETSFAVTGPIVFSNNVADSSFTASETHGTWSTGILYDNLYHVNNTTAGFIALANRGTMGTSLSQGWSAANCIVWNSMASTIIAHKPPGTYQNFLIGNFGVYDDVSSRSIKYSNISTYRNIYRSDSNFYATNEHFATDGNTSFVGDSYKESTTAPVEPRSLYRAQLAERKVLSFKKTKPNIPIVVYPTAEAVIETNQVEITGIYQNGANAVTVYVDNKPINATLDTSSNTFKATTTLEDGYHKIYTTQTINGVEGVKDADRFIKVGSIGDSSNPDYMQSIYSPNALYVEEYAVVTGVATSDDPDIPLELKNKVLKENYDIPSNPTVEDLDKILPKEILLKAENPDGTFSYHVVPITWNISPSGEINYSIKN